MIDSAVMRPENNMVSIIHQNFMQTYKIIVVLQQYFCESCLC